MRQSSSPSTPPSYASRSPYVSFFDLQNMFQCGCTQDVVQFQSKKNMQTEESQPQHIGYDDAFVEYDDSSSLLVDGETTMETAKDYFDRISKQLQTSDRTKRPDAWKPKRSSSVPTNPAKMNSEGVKTIFRIETSNPRNSLRPSIKQSASDSTQITTSMSSDEISVDSEETNTTTKPTIVSILRRKEKMADVTIQTTGAAVRFCPNTVFPETGKKRRPQRTRKPRIQIQPYEDYADEVRRIERRAKQNQHPFITHDLRSPSSDILYQAESFYVFR